MTMELQLLRTRHPPEIFLQQLIELLQSEGFKISLEDIHSRIDKLPGEDRLLLAVEGERLYGYAHLAISHDLMDSETAVVVSVIVRENKRRQGVGRRLIAAAETWASQSGRSRLLLRTDVVRTGAHAFFVALGYDGSSTQLEFIRHLSD
ncbi:MAG: GNAT family N-acetyltransferase [Chloroflexota bacterium]|nr:GNAT family N-acetyltransferase [Chloroflexota bacterium]